MGHLHVLITTLKNKAQKIIINSTELQFFSDQTTYSIKPLLHEWLGLHTHAIAAVLRLKMNYVLSKLYHKTAEGLNSTKTCHLINKVY